MPPNIDGFNLFFLHHNIHSIKTKPTVAALIKRRDSQQHQSICPKVITHKAMLITIMQIKKSHFALLDIRLNRSHIEDFTVIPCGTHACVLVPRKEVFQPRKT